MGGTIVRLESSTLTPTGIREMREMILAAATQYVGGGVADTTGDSEDDDDSDWDSDEGSEDDDEEDDDEEDDDEEDDDEEDDN